MLKKLWKIDKGFVIGVLIITGLLLATIVFYFEGTVLMATPDQIALTTEENNVEVAAQEWFEQYMGLYNQPLLPRKQQINDYMVTNVSLLQEGVQPIVQLDFTVIPQHPSDELTQTFNGSLEDGIIKSQWVLWIDVTMMQEDNLNQYTYDVTKIERPAQYDAEQYYISGEQERDEYGAQSFSSPPLPGYSPSYGQYTYKIEDGICYVSYDTGMTWAEVPLDLESLTYESPYQNQLQEGSYIITPNMTAFIYGGVMNYERDEHITLSMIFSSDEGQTWNDIQINSKVSATRIKFLSFPTQTTGYVVIGHERTMSQELQTIFKTEDGGQTWEIVGHGPETRILQAAGFINDQVGFMIYPYSANGSSIEPENDIAPIIYRTEDGGKTFQSIEIPNLIIEVDGMTLPPFIQPEMPLLDGKQLILFLGQGQDGDYKGGRLMAKFQSDDLGKTWTFVEYYEPEIQEIG